MISKVQSENLKKELQTLQQEHEELNEIIDSSESPNKLDEVTIQRFKKRKLWLKDRIVYLRSLIYPDIIA